EIHELITNYDRTAKDLKLIKFVPASGAATRMFKHLFEFRELPVNKKQDAKILDDSDFNSVGYFFSHLNKFAFYDDLKRIMSRAGLNIEECMKKLEFDTILDFFLTPKGMNYGNLPKGVLKFHHYGTFARTSTGEHLVEGAHYCANRAKRVTVHLTVSPEHLSNFKDLIAYVQPYYESMFGVLYDISFSVQKPSTDTIAVDMDNEPFREKDGSLVFRPAGHGALIENLNDLDCDIVFIKNIDNVVPDRLKAETYRYKKLIGGLLLQVQGKAFSLLKALDKKPPSEETIEEAIQFCEKQISTAFPPDFFYWLESKKVRYLQNLLNRPIRICGMVKNEGEPGGGPFWVKNNEGEVSLQIVESSQIDLKKADQKQIFSSSTHFNPVDLVCSLKNYKGEKFDLHQFIDKNAGFISIKSKDGKQLKALELPGLWNGAMANWITVFVEVPIITFNPVKTVNDLLREQHQN
ncbi:MAG: DUF4301 family protein, partial [Bacteroidales bacterium]|nr:DUF4301 family protein [Bacteroidales bacterium]